MIATEPAIILVVDDESDNFDVIEALLANNTYQLHYASSGTKALERLDRLAPDLLLLDVMMPMMDGFEVCRQLRRHPAWQSLPIILITALDSKEDLAKGLEAGADDFISKPVNRVELRARIRSLLRIRRQQQSIEHLYQQVQSVNLQLTAFNCALERRVQERTAQLERAYFYDSLTQLPSRALLLDTIEQTLRQPEPTPFALLYLDCDQFKLVNGSLGHDIGNKLLVAIALRLQSLLRSGDQLARLGEDEFCFFLQPLASVEALRQFARQVLDSFNSSFWIDSYEIYMTVCIGMTLSRAEYDHAQVPLQEADTAMYQAKYRGAGSCQLFDYQMQRSAQQRLQLEHDLRHALSNQELIAHYQPIIDLATQQIAGFEALVRWYPPKGPPRSPGEFIPCAEETGLIVPIGMVVLRQACQQLWHWQQQGYPHLFMSVNLSVRQFAHPTLVEDIDEVLRDVAIDPGCLKLEITESAIMESPDAAVALTQQLRSRRIQLSIDDFGTGYSSLSYLNRFPVDSLKIDQSFVQSMETDSKNAQIVAAVVGLGHALNIKIIAEGIETTAQLNHLCRLGCDYGQGYLLAQPLPPEQATTLLQKSSALGFTSLKNAV